MLCRSRDEIVRSPQMREQAGSRLAARTIHRVISAKTPDCSEYRQQLLEIASTVFA
jgi:hypothetical protein